MAKSISVDDETYKLIAEFAKEDDRPISNALSRLVKLGLGISRPPENKKVETPNGVGSQANKRLVATGNEHMPVRESLPDELEEALYHYKKISEDLKLDSLRAWCNKMAVDEAWTDEQACIEINKRKQELLAERDEVAAILKENGVSIGI